MRRICGIVVTGFLLAWFSFQQAYGQGLIATAKLDSSEILIGDQVNLRLTLTKPVGSGISFPYLPDTLTKNIEIIDRGRIDTLSRKNNFVTLEQRLLITSFDSGFHTIPCIPFFSETDTIFTDSLMLKVNTVPVDTTKLAIMDIKAPYEEPFTFAELIPYILIGLGVLAFLFLVWFVYRRWKKKKPLLKILEKPAEPAHLIALRELENLKAKKLWQASHFKRYHTELTDIIRKYIEGRFEVAAMEMTSQEVIDSMKKENRFPEALLPALSQMLTLADFVKFAKAEPLPDENDMCMRNAFKIVEETIPTVVIEEVKSVAAEAEKGGDHVG